MDQRLDMLIEAQPTDNNAAPTCVYCQCKNAQLPTILVDWWPNNDKRAHLHIQCAYRLMFNLSQTVGGLLVSLVEERLTSE